MLGTEGLGLGVLLRVMGGYRGIDWDNGKENGNYYIHLNPKLVVVSIVFSIIPI